MPEIVVAAEGRTETGKNINRRLREKGLIPGVVYGAGRKAIPVSVSPKEIASILRSATGENTLFDIEVKGKRHKVILKEYQLEPVKGSLSLNRSHSRGPSRVVRQTRNPATASTTPASMNQPYVRVMPEVSDGR